MLHFCWKPRSAPEPEDDLYIFAGEASFLPYEEAKTGRIYILKFSSSSQRHFFWLQAQSERENEPGYWSERDRKWGRKIDRILQTGGEEAMDEEMGDAPADSGTVEEEGAESRRGGEDGGRA
jgi:26S proteasome regulatory subunit N13